MLCCALLWCRLQVKYIVACIAASEYLGSETKIDDWAYSQWDISALFGAVPLNHKSMKKGKVNGMPPQIFNRVTQVGAATGSCSSRLVLDIGSLRLCLKPSLCAMLTSGGCSTIHRTERSARGDVVLRPARDDVVWRHDHLLLVSSVALMQKVLYQSCSLTPVRRKWRLKH
jgi:hypothetical protein